MVIDNCFAVAIAQLLETGVHLLLFKEELIIQCEPEPPLRAKPAYYSGHLPALPFLLYK
jgi:hypothetical protein